MKQKRKLQFGVKLCLALWACVLLGFWGTSSNEIYAQENSSQIVFDTQFEVGKEVTILKSGGDYKASWTIDGTEVSSGLSYTPTENDLEKWIIVDLMDQAGTVIEEKQVYFSRLPVVYISTEDNEAVTTKDAKAANMVIQGNSEWGEQYSGDIEIKLRGNTSKLYSQKPYKIKLGSSTDLFGMGKSKHWVLISNYMDQCGLRNKLGSEISAELGLNNMDMVWVDVVLNGEYVGMYNLTEHIRVGESRVDIFNWEDEAEAVAKSIYKKNSGTLKKSDRDALEDQLCEDFSWVTTGQVTYKDVLYNISDYYSVKDNISGGYLFELSLEYDEVSKFMTASGMPVMVNTPEFLSTNDGMMNYVKEYWQDFETAIMSQTGYNSKGSAYQELADFDSMVSYWLTMEILGNDDAAWKSRYAYKDMDGKLVFGPAWDFDWGCGSYTVGTNAEGWKISRGSLWKDFIDDPYFQIKAAERYWKLREYLEDIIRDGGYIDTQIEYLLEAGLANDEKYPEKEWYGFERRTFLTDAECFKTYLRERLSWLDEQFASEESLSLSLYLNESTHPYVRADHNLNVLFDNGVADTVSDKLPADVIRTKSEDLNVIVTTADRNTCRVGVYVNGRYMETYELLEGMSAFTITDEWLNADIGCRNVISVYGYDKDGNVTYTNYATAIQSLQEVGEKKPTYHVVYHYGNGSSDKDELHRCFSTLIQPVDPIRDYYIFAGWYGDENCTEEYVFGNKIENDIDLYAKWTPKTYSITYYLDGGQNPEGNPTSYTIEEEVNFAAAEKEGYVFEGWYSDSGYTQKVEGISQGTAGTFELYAKWTKIETSSPVEFNANTPNIAPNNNNSSAQIENSSSTQASNRKYTIKYHLNGGTNASDNPKVISEDEEVVLAKPVRKGYTFKGWYYEKTFKNKVKKLTKGTSRNVDLYAKWEKQKSDISKAKAAKISDRKYTGKGIKPKVQLTFKGKKLKEGRDYTLSYKNNVKGKAKIVIKGKNNYKGKKQITFNIVRKKNV